jgi:hypothetical protein
VKSELRKVAHETQTRLLLPGFDREPRGAGQRPGVEPDVRSACPHLPVSVGRPGLLEPMVSRATRRSSAAALDPSAIMLTRPTEGAA